MCILPAFQCLLNFKKAQERSSILWKILSTTHIHVHVCTHTAKSSKTSKKSKKKQTAHTAVHSPDHTHLTFGHHKTIIATLALLPHLQAHSTHTLSTNAPSDQSESAEGVGGACKSDAIARGMRAGLDARMDLLLVGLGGGALPMFINKCIPNVSCYGFMSVCISHTRLSIVSTHTHTHIQTHTHTYTR